ncbi:hypothetical protein [Herminiimonas aquatilis]|uniref:Uncharacterized protein n=1 Tax=Herminiimonas aquatilis TaxID=345342 RepID=A0ABW2J9X1_9BURK
MREFSPKPPRHMFKAYATRLEDGTFSGHVSHSLESDPTAAERIYDTGIVGTEREALDEAHAFIARYVADHPEGRE